MTNDGPGGNPGRRDRNAAGTGKRSNGTGHARPRWTWIRDVMASDVDQNARHIAHVLAFHMNGDLTAWPNQDTLARLTRLQRRTVQYAIAALVDEGWIVRIRRGRGPGCPNIYTGTWPAGYSAPRASYIAHERGEIAHDTTRDSAPHAPELSRNYPIEQAAKSRKNIFQDGRCIGCSVYADDPDGHRAGCPYA